MEYLSRVLSYTTGTMGFKFHPMCAKLNLSHLMFADDLLLFSKGDVGSIMILLRSFATFSAASGLQMSPTKSDAYFNGVSQGVKADILQVAGLTEGRLPFRYLGVPITVGRLKKLIARIRGFGARHLSYAGRLTLVNSVLTTIYGYWMSVFVLPKGVLHKINSVCRNYLWGGSVDQMRTPPVSWEKVCAPKDEGGLGIKFSIMWNWAMIGKLAWWIYTQPDKLWVQWVSHVYLKGSSWDSYSVHGDVSWGWKMVCKAKNKFAGGYINGDWTLDAKGYTVSSAYNFCRDQFPKVQWWSFVWNIWAVPKHRFISWLVFREALTVKTKLYAWNVCVDEICQMCGLETEDLEHVFWSCSYTVQLMQKWSQWTELASFQHTTDLWRNLQQGTKCKQRCERALIQMPDILHLEREELGLGREISPQT